MREAQRRVLEAMAAGRPLIEAAHVLSSGRRRRYWFVARDAKAGGPLKVHKAHFVALQRAGYLSEPEPSKHRTSYSLTDAGRGALEDRG